MLFDRVVPVGVALACMMVWSFALHELRHDDAFITLRYSQNLALGRGFVFNPGEPRLGTTSPGHALIGAGVYMLFGRDATPHVISTVGCLALVLEALFLYWLFSPTQGRLAAALVSMLAFVGASGHAFIALETNLVGACWLGALLLWRADRTTAAGFVLGLATLLRPDALLAVAVFGVDGLQRRLAPKRAAAAILAMSAVTVPWVLFSWFYFGSPVPLTLATKKFRTTVSDFLTHELTSSVEAMTGYDGVGVVLGVWALVAAGVWTTRKHRELAMVAGVCGAYAAAYAYLRPYTGFTWHLAPVYLGASAFAVLGLLHLGQRDGEKGRRGAVMVLVTLGLFRGADALAFGFDIKDSHWFGGRDQAYRNVAQYFVEHVDTAHERFACVEVGTLAYYSDMAAVDLGGLVSTPTDVSTQFARWLVVDSHNVGVVPRVGKNVFETSAGTFTVVVSEQRP